MKYELPRSFFFSINLILMNMKVLVLGRGWMDKGEAVFSYGLLAVTLPHPYVKRIPVDYATI